MHITRVELENIKSHTSSVFDFGRGSTAITGENGAGKTTIIEAIAWTLFDTLDYKKDDFVQRGARKGSARVSFVSSLDEREYTVYRDTGTAYYVHDPRLNVRAADKKEEVTRFLWQHLGVEPGTDLESLFKQAIGVPQGTLTAVFLATTTERKKTFDALLKVEEYRRGADELLKTSRYVDNQIAAVSVRIARAEGEIARIDTVEAEHKIFASQAADLAAELEKLSVELRDQSESVKLLDEAESKVSGALAELEKLRAEKARAELVFAQREADLKRSRDAAAMVAEVRADAERHLAALARLKELERERAERDKLAAELSKIESAIERVKTEKVHLEKDLENIQAARREIEELSKLVPEQDRLEAEIGHFRNHLVTAEAAARSAKAAEEGLARLRDAYRSNLAQLTAAREKSVAASELERLLTRDSELVREVAALQAALERDEAFQKEIRNGLCPILSEKCLNLKEGETLESFVTSQFDEIRLKIVSLQRDQASNSMALKISRDAEKSSAQLSVLENRENEIKEEGKRLKAERAAYEKESELLPQARAALEKAEAELKALGNPKIRISVLEKDTNRDAEIRRSISESEKNLERLESDQRITVEKLESYKDLDVQWEESSRAREETAESYRILIANEAAASQLGENERACEAAKQTDGSVAEKLDRAETVFEAAGKGYDRERHLSERAKLITLQRREAELNASSHAAEKRETELAAELARLIEIRRSMHDEFREKERHEKVAEVTEFIRTTLKEAAPLVARNYVYHVSIEANQMFREITGNAEQSLKWGEDYGIVLEEGGFERPFQSLSGGEQMAAALAVRLALLKQLSDIRIAFFDEPTTNLDADRRENLAMQIGQIRHFDQLFVISHDDTFEGYMDHEISLGFEVNA
jgi:DNA repair protein SbcC/Rad50